MPLHAGDEPLKGAAARLYQRNIENLCRDEAILREEIRTSVAELFDAAVESRAAIAIKGAPEQHAEGANGPGDEDG